MLPLISHAILPCLLLLIAVTSVGQTPEQKLAQPGIQLPKISAPIVSYVH
jgi:hypothetical protein